MSHKRSKKIATLKDEWQTPQWLFNLLDREFHFDCDAAATEENTKCFFYFDKGRSGPWFEPIPLTLGFNNVFWLNPPYSAGNIDRFMQKAYEESQKGAVVVCLVPVASDTRWWHLYVMKAQEIRFIKSRVRFVGYDEAGNQIRNSPTFASCIVIFDRQLWQGNPYPWIGKTIEQPKKERK